MIHTYLHTYIHTYIHKYILCITEMKTESVLWQIWQIKFGMETHQGAAESLKEELQVAYIYTDSNIHAYIHILMHTYTHAVGGARPGSRHGSRDALCEERGRFVSHLLFYKQ